MDSDRDKHRFVDLILDEGANKSYGTWAKTHESLQRYPDQLSLLIKNARYQNTFITNFKACTGRIIKFLQSTDNNLPRTPDGYRSRKAIGHQTVERLVIPLLEEQPYNHLTKLEIFLELLINSLLLTGKSGNRLRNLAIKLANSPELLGKIVSSYQIEGFLGEWIDSFGQVHPHAATLAAWTETIVNLCDTCGHDNQDLIDKWKSLRTLRDQLYQARTFLKYNAADRLTFPEGIGELLQEFELQMPRSESAVSVDIDHIDIKVTLDLLLGLAKSMPCRLCFSRLSGEAGSHTLVGKSLRRTSTTTFDEFEEMEFVGLQYEELLGKRLGCWKIVLSGQALKDLQKSKTEGNFEHIKNKLGDLSTGDWVRRSVAKPVSLGNITFKVRLFEAKYASNGRILWQVDQGYDEGVHKQIVRVWKIGDVKEYKVREAYNLVFRDQNAWSFQRIANCKLNRIDKALGIKLPAILSDNEQDELNASDSIVGPDIFENRTALDILITGKFHVLTNRVFDNIIHGNHDAEFPFDVSSTEIRVIKHFQTAAFVLGRSGTGKTTCLLYKLLCRYLASAQNVGNENCLRQILLTRSEPLARKLKSELHQLIKAQLITQKSISQQGTMTPSAGNTQEGEVSETGALAIATKSLFSLQPEDFPLVCTFGQFLLLLENTIRAHDRQNFSSSTQTRGSGYDVDFTVFKAGYWPKMHMSRQFDPGLVYSEIMGVIKGTGSFKNNFRPLSRDEYITRSVSLAPAFPTTNEREQLYAFYERYESLKSQRHEYDSIDNVLGILNGIRNESMQRKLYDIVQEIYVDEVQDQRAIEIELLLHLVQNPRGIHFGWSALPKIGFHELTKRPTAGDSAQCISNDSAFRFANIKALFYDHYFQFDPQLAKPELFSLAKNFRSHQGILSLASFVMGLLWKGFPNMVDKLSPEIGQFLGPKPVIFVGANIDEILIRAGNLNSAQTKQTIIVRDRETGTALQPKLKGNSIFYTILESKGMEYDDVYLYNFFSSSPYPSGWRTLDILLPEGTNPWYASKNLTMCSELKNLYVAITRPKSRLWILETQSNPFIELLASCSRLDKELVDIRSSELEDLQTFVQELGEATTTKEEWDREGEQCMDQKLYNQALRCFQNSGDETKIIWATACIAEVKGREHQAKGEMNLFKKHFKEAAENFLTINRIWRAAECLEALGEFARAAELWLTQSRYEHAGTLFERAGSGYISQAVGAYYKAKLPIVALNLLLRAGLYKTVIEDLARCQNQISASERQPIARKLNTLLRRGKIPKQLKEQTFNLLVSYEEKKAFLKDFGHFDELWHFLEQAGRLNEAVDELMDAHELDLLLRNSYKANEKWQESQKRRLSEIYNCVSANKLLSAIASNKEVDAVLQSSLNSPYAKATWGQKWSDQLRVMEDIIKSRVLPVRDTLDKISTWSANFLTAILILYPDFYLNEVDNVSQLFITMKYVEWMNISVTKLEISSAVSICLGLFNIGDGLSYRPFRWSMMVANPTPHQTVSVPEANRYLKTKSNTALEKLIHQAKSDVLIKTFQLCSLCVRRATESSSWTAGKPTVGFQEEHSKHGCYAMQSPIIFRERLWEMVETCRILGEISMSKTPGLAAQNTTGLATKIDKDLISQLISLLTYESSYSHDAATIIHITKRLANEEQYDLLREIIKNHIPKPKLYDPGWTQNDFVLLFRKHRLLRMLTIPPSMHDEGYQIRTILLNITAPEQQFLSESKGMNNLNETELHLQPHVELLKCYYSLQTISPNEEFSAMLDLVQTLIGNLKTFIYSDKFVSYTTELVSIFEDITSLLVFTGWKTELLVPKSWRERYMPDWFIYFGKASHDEQLQCRRALRDLVMLFCELVNWLGDANESQVSGKLLNRRILDFLVIALVNVCMTNPDQSNIDFGDFFSAVQKILRRKLPMVDQAPIRGPAQCVKLIHALLHAFRCYNGKDHLCLLICRSQHIQGIRLSPHKTWLRTLGVELESRPDCSLKQNKCGTHALKSRPTTPSLVMVMVRLNAANLIQRCFRDHRLRTVKSRAPAAKTILRFYRNYIQRRAEKRANAVRVIQTAYRKLLRRKAELRAHELIHRAWFRYKRDKDYINSRESKAVRSIQIAFQKKRETKPELTKKEYYTFIMVMLTEGMELTIKLLMLEERCDTLLTQAKDIFQKSKITDPRRRALKVKKELCQSSDTFRGLSYTEMKLRKRIFQGLELVNDINAELDDVAIMMEKDAQMVQSEKKTAREKASEKKAVLAGGSNNASRGGRTGIQDQEIETFSADDAKTKDGNKASRSGSSNNASRGGSGGNKGKQEKPWKR